MTNDNATILTMVVKYLQKKDTAKNPVFFGGAGVSAASGIPDYRHIERHTSYSDVSRIMRPERLRDEDFQSFFKRFFYWPEAKPNHVHTLLALWGWPVITQNIDGLHQKAGSTDVLELHGSIHQTVCMSCVHKSNQTPFIKCPVCGDMMRPDITLYSESPKQPDTAFAVQALDQADFIIVGGTSLRVSPARNLIRFTHTHNILLINKEPTPLDHRARWVIREDLSVILEALDKVVFRPNIFLEEQISLIEKRSV